MRALRLEPQNFSPNVIGGYQGNFVALGYQGATIGGGGYFLPGGSSAINSVSGDFGTVSGGDANRVVGIESTIGGGSGNIVSGARSTISGGGGNTISKANEATIGGGSGNSIQTNAHFATIGGGTGNAIQTNSSFSTIAGGISNTIERVVFNVPIIGAAIGGGASNRANGEYSTIAGGMQNRIWTGTIPFSSYGGGMCTIGGGASNDIIGEASYPVYGVTIAGGIGNRIAAFTEVAFIGGGLENSIRFDSWGSVIGGGSDNKLDEYTHLSVIAGGRANTIGGPAHYATISGGLANDIAARYATIPGGTQAKASSYGQMAYASGQFTAVGDAQTSVFVCRGTTTDATPTDLLLDGASARMVMAINSTWGFDILVMGRASGGDSAAYHVRGAIKNNGGNTTLVPSPNGSPNFLILAEDVAGWDATAAADNARDALVVRVTGAAGTAIRWVATVRTVEASY